MQNTECPNFGQPLFCPCAPKSRYEADDFRRIALCMPEAKEVYHRGRSEFRMVRRIFASLEGPADSVATIILTAEQQATFLHTAPGVFLPAAGGWGRLVSTLVRLVQASAAIVEGALVASWRNVAPKALLKQLDQPPTIVRR